MQLQGIGCKEKETDESSHQGGRLRGSLKITNSSLADSTVSGDLAGSLRSQSFVSVIHSRRSFCSLAQTAHPRTACIQLLFKRL